MYDAWDLLAGALNRPPETVTHADVEQTEDHDDAGWFLELLLDGDGDPHFTERAARFERENIVDYPRHLCFMQEIIERGCKVIEPDT